MNWWLARLKEPSTWRGLVWLATVAGLALSPEQAEAIIAVGMALAGLLGVFLSDEPKTRKIELPPIALQGRAGAGDVDLGIGTVQPVDELRLSADSRPGAAGTANANPPRPSVGFGDRDSM